MSNLTPRQRRRDARDIITQLDGARREIARLRLTKTEAIAFNERIAALCAEIEQAAQRVEIIEER